MLLRPDGPGRDDRDEEEQISPTEEETKTQAGFAEKDREQNENACEIEKAFQTLAQASEAGAEPNAGEPGAPEPASLITADRTKNSAGDKSAEDRFGGDSATEEERAGETEMDQARGETSFVTGQAFTDQEGQSDRRDQGDRDGQARGDRCHAEDFVGQNNDPVDERRGFQPRHAIIGGKEPLLRGQHFASAAGELSFHAVMEIAPAGRGEMKDSGEREEKNEKSVSGRRWIEHLRLEKRVFEREGASAGIHGDFVRRTATACGRLLGGVGPG